MKVSEAQKRRLMQAPEDWDRMPSFGDQRSIQPLENGGLIEVRRRDVTPAGDNTPIRTVAVDWRITDAGRAARALG